MNCKNFGDLYTSSTGGDNGHMGGLFGNVAKYSTNKNVIVAEGCVVNCNITASYYTLKTVEGMEMTTAKSVGFVFGRSGGAKNQIYYGTAENPVKVSGKLTVLDAENGSETVLTTENFKGYLTGNGSATSVSGGSTATDLANVVYEVVNQ